LDAGKEALTALDAVMGALTALGAVKGSLTASGAAVHLVVEQALEILGPAHRRGDLATIRSEEDA
jgi:hypothetical protein